MRKAILILLLILGLLPSVAAAQSVDHELLVRRVGPRVNVRVLLYNYSEINQPGPIRVELLARAGAGEPWQTVRVWSDIGGLESGRRVSRDLFEENSLILKDLAQRGPFQVRITVSAPGMWAEAEEDATRDTETGR
jgi:hypothetical protein